MPAIAVSTRARNAQLRHCNELITIASAVMGGPAPAPVARIISQTLLRRVDAITDGVEAARCAESMRPLRCGYCAGAHLTTDHFRVTKPAPWSVTYR